jgi:hypothetical protein
MINKINDDINKNTSQASRQCRISDKLPASHRGSPGSIPGHVSSVVDKVTLGQIFSEYVGFPCQFSFHQLLYIY